MEASPPLPQHQEPSSAEHDALTASTESLPIIEIPSKPQDTGCPSEHQEHHLEPSVETTVMDTPPLTSSIQEHHKEPKIAPEELNHSKPAPEANIGLHSHSQEHYKEVPSKNSSSKTSSENDFRQPSTTQEDHQKEASSTKGVTDSSSEHHHKLGHLKELVVNKVSSEHHQGESNEKGSSAASHQTGSPPQGQLVMAIQPQHHAHHATDPVEAPMKTADPEINLNPMKGEPSPVFEQRPEVKQLSPPLEEQHSSTSMEQNLNVPLQHSEHGPTDLSSEQSQVERIDQSMVSATMQGNAEPLAVKHHDSTEKPQLPSILSQQEPESLQKVVLPLVTTSSAEVPHQNSTEQPEFQIPILRSSQKSTRAEIDTAAPFESVKAAVSLFGERVDWKAQTRPPQMQSVERRVLPEAELLKVQDDLVHYKDQLSLTQASTAGVLLELKKVKRLIQNPANKLGGTDILSDKSLEAANTWKKTGPAPMDKSNNELMTILREVESVKEEIISVTVSKEAAVKGLQDALSSLNSVLKRVDELAAEKKSLDEAAADAHIALADAEEQVALLKSGQKVESLNNMPSDFMEKKSAEIRGLESKLDEAKAMITTLKEELLASKKAESLATAAASETQQKMAKVKLELEEAKSEELSMVGKLATILEESDDLKAKLEGTVQKNATLSSTIEALKLNIERDHKEFDSMHEKEQMACATLASLQDELQKLKEALRSAQGGEARALVANDTLPAAIKQAASEADQAKAAAETSKEEARRARQEIEQAKAATSTATSRQQAALKELEAARASEAMALAELKALTESESQSADTEFSEAEGVTGVSISLEEYSSLKQAAIEAEGRADKKVAEVIAQVEAAKASQEKAQLKLDEVAKEAEKGLEELTEAQKQADDAQEAKLTAEGDLRKWRAEHDQRRKSGGPPLDAKGGIVRNSARKDSDDERLAKFGSYEKQDVAAQGKKAGGRDSLAQVMSLEVPTPERLERLLTVEDSTGDKVKVKKRNLIRRLTAIVALKKKP